MKSKNSPPISDTYRWQEIAPAGVFSGHCRSTVTRKIVLSLTFWLDHETSDSDSFINNAGGGTVTRQAHVSEVDAATGIVR